jgi:SAM-dependent methyltransferase
MFSVDFLDDLRRVELQIALEDLDPGAKVLEFGAGTGVQARTLASLGHEVVAIDLPTSGYSQSRVYPVLDYDGENIPLPDASVDVIFSSNVLEHVENFPKIAREFHRVTRPGGYGIHIMPSVAWRAWTFASGVPNAAVAAAVGTAHLVRPPAGVPRSTALKQDLKTIAGSILPIGHGTSSEGLSELWTFSASAWRRRFRTHGFQVVRHRPIGLFHTGHMLFGRGLSVAKRRQLARFIGSAANLFVVRADNTV